MPTNEEIRRDPILELLSLLEIAPDVPSDESELLAWKAREIRHNRERNAIIKRLALGLMHNDDEMLAQLGLMSSRAVNFLRFGRGNVAILVESLKHAHALSELIEDAEIVTGMQPCSSKSRVKIVVPASNPRFRVPYVVCIQAHEFSFAPRPTIFPAAPDPTSSAVLEIDFRDNAFIEELRVAYESFANRINDFGICDASR